MKSASDKNPMGVVVVNANANANANARSKPDINPSQSEINYNHVLEREPIAKEIANILETFYTKKMIS
jgi:hypothetical protein